MSEIQEEIIKNCECIEELSVVTCSSCLEDYFDCLKTELKAKQSRIDRLEKVLTNIKVITTHMESFVFKEQFIEDIATKVDEALLEEEKNK